MAFAQSRKLSASEAENILTKIYETDRSSYYHSGHEVHGRIIGKIIPCGGYYKKYIVSAQSGTFTQRQLEEIFGQDLSTEILQVS